MGQRTRICDRFFEWVTSGGMREDRMSCGYVCVNEWERGTIVWVMHDEYFLCASLAEEASGPANLSTDTNQ